MDPPEDQTSDTPTAQVYEGQPFGNVFDEPKLDDDIWASGGGLWKPNTFILPEDALTPTFNAQGTTYTSTVPVATSETPFSSLTVRDTFPTSSRITNKGQGQPEGVIDWDLMAHELYRVDASGGVASCPGSWMHGTLSDYQDPIGIMGMPIEGNPGGPALLPSGDTFPASRYERTVTGFETFGRRTIDSVTSGSQPRASDASGGKFIACASCSKAKAKCDKARPSCSRCTSKMIQCEPRTTARGTFHRSSWSPY